MMHKPHAATALIFRIVKWGSLFVVSFALVLFFLHLADALRAGGNHGLHRA